MNIRDGDERIRLSSEDFDLIIELACSLDEKPGKNWVERAGGLPEYICRIARAVKRSGKTTSQAVAIAVSRVKVWAAGGDNVNAKTQAKAAAALAAWEKLKAKSKAKTAKKELKNMASSSEFVDKIVKLHGHKGQPGYALLHSPDPGVRLKANEIYNKALEMGANTDEAQEQAQASTAMAQHVAAGGDRKLITEDGKMKPVREGIGNDISSHASEAEKETAPGETAKTRQTKGLKQASEGAGVIIDNEIRRLAQSIASGKMDKKAARQVLDQLAEKTSVPRDKKRIAQAVRALSGSRVATPTVRASVIEEMPAGKILRLAVLSTKKRKKLPSDDFAIPEEKKYPINDRAHARNALVRVAQYGTPEEKRRVRAAVKRKYPDMDVSDD